MKNDEKILKQLAHNLKLVVLVGKNGLTSNLEHEINAKLDAHELIKIKFQDAAVKKMADIISLFCANLNAKKIETKGHTVTVFRRNTENPKIDFSKAKLK